MRNMSETWDSCNIELCDAQCCKHLTFDYSKPLPQDFIRFLKLHGCTLVNKRERKGHELQWKTYVRIPIKCRMLGEDNRCTIYDDRPEHCKRSPNKESVFITKEICSVLNPELLKHDAIKHKPNPSNI